MVAPSSAVPESVGVASLVSDALLMTVPAGPTVSTVNNLRDELIILLSDPVSITATVSKPSPIAETSVELTEISQAPDPLTIVEFPSVSVAPELNERLTLLPGSPVPVSLNPAVFSPALITSSVATIATVGIVLKSPTISGTLG